MKKNTATKKVISLFDIIGPIMVGPSSSHTAGAARIGYEAYKILGGMPLKVEINLYNSFADTGKGHKTDLAVLGGCLGLKPNNVRLRKSAELAKKEKVKYTIKWNCFSKKLHPNTAIVRLENKTHVAGLAAYSIGGGQIKIVKAITKAKNGKTITLKEIEKQVPQYNENQASLKQNYLSFDEFKQEVRSIQQYYKLVIGLEKQLNNQNETEILDQFGRYYEIMKASVDRGLYIKKRTKYDLYGGDARKVHRSKHSIVGLSMRRALAYSLASAENNARMGKIVASPTAGSCGVIPATLCVLEQKEQLSQTKIAQSLVMSASIGAIVANKVALAGAVAGCQAELGVAGAMAASAGVYLYDGSLEQFESAASIVLANLLGLTCDPVLGLVEVPCIIRNATVTSIVFSAIQMAMSGVIYPIPFDEVVDVMKKVGQDMSIDYKETSRGGLAQTSVAKAFCAKCSKCRS